MSISVIQKHTKKQAQAYTNAIHARRHTNKRAKSKRKVTLLILKEQSVKERSLVKLVRPQRGADV